MSTLSLLVAQSVLWLKYGTVWALVLPAVFFGALASYFTVKDRALFELIWKNHSSGMLQVLSVITVICVVCYFSVFQSKFWFMSVILVDCLLVYWMTMLGWLVRERLT